MVIHRAIFRGGGAQLYFKNHGARFFYSNTSGVFTLFKRTADESVSCSHIFHFAPSYKDPESAICFPAYLTDINIHFHMEKNICACNFGAPTSSVEAHTIVLFQWTFICSLLIFRRKHHILPHNCFNLAKSRSLLALYKMLLHDSSFHSVSFSILNYM